MELGCLSEPSRQEDPFYYWNRSMMASNVTSSVAEWKSEGRLSERNTELLGHAIDFVKRCYDTHRFMSKQPPYSHKLSFEDLDITYNALGELARQKPGDWILKEVKDIDDIFDTLKSGLEGMISGGAKPEQIDRTKEFFDKVYDGCSPEISPGGCY